MFHGNLIFQGLPVRPHFQFKISEFSNSSFFGVLKLILKWFGCSSKPNKGIKFLCLFIESFSNRQFGSNRRNPQPKNHKSGSMCGLVLPLQWTPKKWEEQGQHISRSITHADSRQTWQTGLFLFSHSVPNWRKFLQWQISITHFKQTSKAFKYQHGACMSLYRASDTGRPHTWGRLSVSLFSPQSLFPPHLYSKHAFVVRIRMNFPLILIKVRGEDVNL